MNESLIRRPGIWISIFLHIGIFLALYQHRYINPKIDSFRELAEFNFEDKPKEIKSIEKPMAEPKHVNPSKQVSVFKQPPTPNPTPNHPLSSSKSEEANLEPAPRVEELNRNEELKRADELIKPSLVEKADMVPDTPKKVVINVDNESSKIKGAWGKYGHQISEEANRHRAYPAQAIAAHMQGTVIIVIKIKPNGQVETGISQSSGFDVIDFEAMKMIEKALKRVAIPDELKNKPKDLFVPIGFKL